MKINKRSVIAELKTLSDPSKISLKEQKFGICANNSLGVYQKDLKRLAKEIGQDNKLALELYESGIYEARILCSKIFSPRDITEELMETWASEFENWEICDSFCMGFFARSDLALSKAIEWSNRDEEFVKRAGFVIMAAYGFAHKEADNHTFTQFFPIIKREVNDSRLYVKKAVNWALRNIGKRNSDLKKQALELAYEILEEDTKSARWIANDAIRELKKPDLNVLDYPRSIYRQGSK